MKALSNCRTHGVALATLIAAGGLACSSTTAQSVDGGAPPNSPPADAGAPDASAGPPPTDALRLTLLHNNDGESQLVNAGSSLADWGGAARFSTLVKQLRGEASTCTTTERACSALVVSSGDNILPGPELQASRDRGVPYFDSIAIGLIGYDALALGNHDFDLGPDVLADLIEGTPPSIPFVSANLDFSGEPRLAALVAQNRLAASHIVTTDSGHRVGFIGLTTPSITNISAPRNVAVSEDLAGAVTREVDRLQNEGINLIVLLSHLQNIARDRALVAQTFGVDVVVAGGGDELLMNPGTPLVPGDEAIAPAGPYPLMAPDADQRMVPIVTTPGSYRYLGRLVVDFDAAGNVTGVDASSGLVRVAGGAAPDAVTDDPRVQSEVVAPLETALAGLSSNVVGTSEVPLNGMRDAIRGGETNLGNLVADAMLWHAIRVASQHNLAAPVIGLINGGGIRNDSVIPAGPITELDTFNILPFPNFVSIVPDVPPAKLKEILEHSIASLGGGGFLHVGGMTMRVDLAQPTSRVQRVALDDGTLLVDGGVPVEGAPAVGIATISFLASGGGGAPFPDLAFTNVGESYQQALAGFIKDGLSGRIPLSRYPEGGSGRIVR